MKQSRLEQFKDKILLNGNSDMVADTLEISRFGKSTINDFLKKYKETPAKILINRVFLLLILRVLQMAAAMAIVEREHRT